MLRHHLPLPLLGHLLLRPVVPRRPLQLLLAPPQEVLVLQCLTYLVLKCGMHGRVLLVRYCCCCLLQVALAKSVAAFAVQFLCARGGCRAVIMLFVVKKGVCFFEKMEERVRALMALVVLVVLVQVMWAGVGGNAWRERGEAVGGSKGSFVRRKRFSKTLP